LAPSGKEGTRVSATPQKARKNTNLPPAKFLAYEVKSGPISSIVGPPLRAAVCRRVQQGDPRVFRHHRSWARTRWSAHGLAPLGAADVQPARAQRAARRHGRRHAADSRAPRPAESRHGAARALAGREVDRVTRRPRHHAHAARRHAVPDGVCASNAVATPASERVCTRHTGQLCESAHVRARRGAVCST